MTRGRVLASTSTVTGFFPQLAPSVASESVGGSVGVGPLLFYSLPTPARRVLMWISLLSTEEIETLAATDRLDLSAPWGDDGLTALHRATLAGSMGALQTVRRNVAASACQLCTPWIRHERIVFTASFTACSTL